MADAVADPSSDGTAKPYTPDDLVELVRAVKFAHSDMSLRNVHHEISVTMASANPSYQFLKEVKLNDVKKVWKRALKGASRPEGEAAPSSPPNQNAAGTKTGGEPVFPTDGVIKFYTVGDGSVKALAESYENHYAKAAARQNDEMEQEAGKYTHFFLDVPADLSGSRPHQALINFEDNKRGDRGRGKAKKKDRATGSDGGGRETFKIQLAALPPGMEDFVPPMLLYNADRTAKTFLHPPSRANDDEDDGGYFAIRKLIAESGTTGALGATGGQKAYFYGFITKTQLEKDVVSIDISGLAPPQTW